MFVQELVLWFYDLFLVQVHGSELTASLSLSTTTSVDNNQILSTSFMPGSTLNTMNIEKNCSHNTDNSFVSLLDEKTHDVELAVADSTQHECVKYRKRKRVSCYHVDIIGDKFWEEHQDLVSF